MCVVVAFGVDWSKKTSLRRKKRVEGGQSWDRVQSGVGGAGRRERRRLSSQGGLARRRGRLMKEASVVLA